MKKFIGVSIGLVLLNACNSNPETGNQQAGSQPSNSQDSISKSCAITNDRSDGGEYKVRIGSVTLDGVADPFYNIDDVTAGIKKLVDSGTCTANPQPCSIKNDRSGGGQYKIQIGSATLDGVADPLYNIDDVSDEIKKLTESGACTKNPQPCLIKNDRSGGGQYKIQIGSATLDGVADPFYDIDDITKGIARLHDSGACTN